MSALRERVQIERQITRLQYSLSIDALQLSEEYQKRIEVLKALDFVDSTGMVTFKGRVACEIHHQELLITELILSKKLHEKSPAEVAAMFSATTCQYKGGDGPQFDKDSIFFQLKEDVQSTNDWIEGRAALVKARIADVGDELRYDLMEVVYHWASGMLGRFGPMTSGTLAEPANPILSGLLFDAGVHPARGSWKFSGSVLVFVGTVV
ncbi:DSHCT domain protein [Teladorsagia circumcincta]|uniref:DSHCT domain protein n=1 Tax=Teladorsagia circumcincta TaxID=45464 RepID=A0A2G9USS9_TELCI|nr:DSHCT domain protein [Teladorsagia circumcincta]